MEAQVLEEVLDVVAAVLGTQRLALAVHRCGQAAQQSVFRVAREQRVPVRAPQHQGLRRMLSKESWRGRIQTVSPFNGTAPLAWLQNKLHFPFFYHMVRP